MSSGAWRRDTEPVIEQVLVNGAEGDELERKLFVARKTAEKTAAGLDAEMPGIAENFYVCTMSGRTIVYKGMLGSAVVGAFYLDLKDEDFEGSSASTTAASPPTPCPSGPWRSPCASSATTVRSTPSRATSTGWRPRRRT